MFHCIYSITQTKHFSSPHMLYRSTEKSLLLVITPVTSSWKWKMALCRQWLMHLSSASTLVVSILENMSFEFLNCWSHGSVVAVLLFTIHVSGLKSDLLSIMALNIVDYVWPLRSTILILTDIHQYRMCKIISTGLIDVLPPAKHPLGSQTVVH